MISPKNNKQNQNQQEQKEGQGGYMRSLHTVEEKIYSLKISAAEMKVLLYIRHNTIRWDMEMCEFSYSDISTHTNIHKDTASSAIKSLKKRGLILVETKKLNGVFTKNKIGLDPKYFGHLIEETCRPKLSIMQGGKSEKLSTGGGQTAPTLTVNSPPPYGSNHPHLHSQEPLPEREASSLKNPLKEPIKKLLGGIEDSFTFSRGEMGPEDIENRKRFLREQARGLEANTS